MVTIHSPYLAPPAPALVDYAAVLFSRVGEGVIVPRVALTIDGWEAKPNQCHENVYNLAGMGLGYKPVTGWLYFDLLYLFPYVRFTAHTVVENGAGELLDITPLPPERPNAAQYPFIRSGLSHDDFHSAVHYLTEAHGTAHLDHML